MGALADSPKSTWGEQIRAREEALRLAILHADLRALDELIADGWLVNSTMHKVLGKPLLLQLLETGRLRHLSYESRIETMHRTGDTVVVMGGDRVVDGPERVCSTRRFTNLWQLDGARWRATARHAHVVTRVAATTVDIASAIAPPRAYQPTP